MSKIENSMKQFMFKSSILDMVNDFMREQEYLTSDDKKTCNDFIETVVLNSVPSSEWNIRVFEDDGVAFDEFLQAQLKCTIELVCMLLVTFIENLQMKKIINNEQ